jgi:GntR family transcriptional regulator/MocR family aminotransferase
MRSVRAAWRDSPLTTGGFGDPRGAPQLREQLSRYLGRVRGAAADPEHTMVCSGLRHGLSLACRRLREHGASAIAVEDPGAHTHRLSVEHAGLDVVPIPVDDQGIDVAALREHDVGAVIVTSAHQFPTAVVLSPERRSALIAWAAATDSLIIEDDYDSELRFDRVAVGALQGLAPEHVLLIGSAGQRLIPGLRMGWMLSPSWLSWPLIETRAVEDGGPEIVGQLALADFIARGELDRHLKRMRSRYAQSREVLLAALASHLPRARPCGAPAGLHELVMLEAGCDESRLVAAATDDGVALHGLAHHRFADAGPPGLVLGYGNLSPSAIDHGIALLARRSKSASNA